MRAVVVHTAGDRRSPRLRLTRSLRPWTSGGAAVVARPMAKWNWPTRIRETASARAEPSSQTQPATRRAGKASARTGVVASSASRSSSAATSPPEIGEAPGEASCSSTRASSAVEAGLSKGMSGTVITGGVTSLSRTPSHSAWARRG